MTGRLKGVVVTFTHDVREDDAEAIIAAIRMVRGVQDVSAVPAEAGDYIVRLRAKAEMEGLLWDAIKKFLP